MSMPKNRENIIDNSQSMMMKDNAQTKYYEIPYYNVMDLLKRLVHKDDSLHTCYNENQHLKMLMGQNKSLVNHDNDLQCTIAEAQGNLHANNEMHQQIKLKHDEL